MTFCLEFSAAVWCLGVLKGLLDRRRGGWCQLVTRLSRLQKNALVRLFVVCVFAEMKNVDLPMCVCVC